MGLRTEIEDAYKQLGAYATGLGSTVKELDSFIPDGERVYALISGKLDNTFGLAALTGNRIVFHRKMLGMVRSREIPLDTVTSVGTTGTPVFCTVTVTFAGGNATFIQVPTKAARTFSDSANKLVSSRNRKSNGDESTIASQLLQLKQLLDAGILTDAEYEKKSSSLKKLL
jgi:hypothetical protein